MAFLKFKSSVVVPKTVIIAAAAINAWHELQLPGDLTVTSGNDSVHSKGSLHYKDCALDLRSKTLTTVQKHTFAKVLQRRLGRDYDVILEDEGKTNEHLHVEYDPHG